MTRSTAGDTNAVDGHPTARAALPAAVLFDMDGTLLDTEHLWLRAETAVMTALGAEWTETDQAFLLGGPLEKAFAYMKERSGTDLPGEEVGRLLLDEMESLLRGQDVMWRPGARDLLLDVHAAGVPTALVTASWRVLVDAVHDRVASDLTDSATTRASDGSASAFDASGDGARVGVSTRQPFDVIVAGDEVADTKPHPEPYLRAAALLGVDIADCLALEDSPTGVASAAAAGAWVVAIPHLAPVVMAPRVRTIPTLDGTTLMALWQHVRA